MDPVVNGGKVTVTTGYDAAATSIVLATGHGAELPDPVVDGAYNLPWWDSTNYLDPADDPNYEIVRVTGPAGTGDTKTIVRAQEGTAASNKNNTDATYKMHLGVTAKTITDAIAISNATGMEDQSFTNLLDNGDFESWSAGITTAPDKWTLGGAGASIARDVVNFKYGKYGVALTYGSATAQLYNDTILNIVPAINIAGGYCSASVYGKTDTENHIRLRIKQVDGTGASSSYSEYHPGDDTQKLLSVSRFIPTDCTVIVVYMEVYTEGTGYFDGLIMVKGEVCPAFTPKSLSANDLTIHMQTPQLLDGAGAVDIVTDITHLDTDGVDAFTLADGANGQEKFIIMIGDDGDGTLTPTNPGNFATITFNDVGDSAHLLFTNGAWHWMGGTATLA